MNQKDIMTHLPLPPHAALSAAAGELTQTIAPAVVRRAHYALLEGLHIHAVDGGFLIPSFDRHSSEVYFVSHLHGCECRAKKVCKHEAALAILELAHAHPTMPRLFNPEDGDGPNPGADEPGIGDGEGDSCPEEWRSFSPARVLTLMRAKRVANAFNADIFG